MNEQEYKEIYKQIDEEMQEQSGKVQEQMMEEMCKKMHEEICKKNNTIPNEDKFVLPNGRIVSSYIEYIVNLSDDDNLSDDEIEDTSK
jgi:cob(I)alamin adenosyltransferase